MPTPMPTHEENDRFLAEYARLDPGQQVAFKRAVRKLVHDLRTGRIRKGLRVKPFRRLPGTWEMTWASNGRALFRYGGPVHPGDPHVVWLRIGGHEIFDEP